MTSSAAGSIVMSSSTSIRFRNQWGQAHVNPDLTSLSWLAIPPYAVGYHTGVLRVDGHVWAAQRFRWAPWGVDREVANDDLVVRSTVSMAYEATRVSGGSRSPMLGSAPSGRPRPGPVRGGRSFRDRLGFWTYGTPWSRGKLPRLPRDGADPCRNDRAGAARSTTPPDGSRALRLGRPRLPGSSATRTATRCSSSRPCRITPRPMLPAIGCQQSSARSPRSH